MCSRWSYLSGMTTTLCDCVRPMAVVVICSVVLISVAHSKEAAPPAAADSKVVATPTPAAPEPIAEPSPQFSPEDVVRKQMQALSGVGPVEGRIDRCYRFASPDNRAHTGPLARFATMVQAPQYQALLNAKQFLVGSATLQNDEAHLLVTAVDPVGELTLFRFFLSKQVQGPYAGCWMTDAVIRVGVINQPDDKAPKSRVENPTI